MSTARKSGAQVIGRGAQRARTGPWHGRTDIAFLHPVPESPALSPQFVRRCLDRLAASGYTRVVTGALSPAEQAGFLEAGFMVSEPLHVLAHDLARIPQPPVVDRFAFRRARPTDSSAILTVDHASFTPFWRLDVDGIRDAVDATPAARFRLAEEDGAGAAAYAITGRAGKRGFLQRLAVHPRSQGLGLGRVLVVDALRWLRRWRVDRAMVNTQVDNLAALALYESVGFRLEPSGLCVLTAEVER